ncbi:hypothetical protein B0H19DRAFT_1231450 [Mycena capillaripes]|nr:hypothetical protein B0H19DRAFT_1231450 [Mycena capillaripes]
MCTAGRMSVTVESTHIYSTPSLRRSPPLLSFIPSTMTGRTFITAVLGTPDGSSDHFQANLCFLVDFLFAAHLLSGETPQAKQLWLTQIDVYKKLKDLKFTSNFALHKPLIPSDDEDDYFFEQHGPGQLMKEVFLNSIKMQVGRMHAGDHQIILLVGRGQDHEDDTLRGRVECGVDSRGNIVWLHKTEVESAVKKSPGRTSLISTACFASAWRSDSWGPFAAAQDGESLGLPASESNRSWGSSFFSSIPEMVATEHELTTSNVAKAFRILLTRGLQRQPPNPAEWELLTGRRFGGEDESHCASVSSGESESESSSNLPNDEPEIIDHAELEDMVSRWYSRTRPLELTTAARQLLGILVSRYRAGDSNSRERRALFRLFKTRMAAEQRAQQLVEELGFANKSISCMDFREVDSIPSCQGISFHSVRWGELAPKDDIFVDRLQHQYRKAGQWVF